MSGMIQVVGIGPGAPELLTAAAHQAIETADVILGYVTYIHLIRDLAPHIPRETSGMRQEVARANRAIDLALAGKRVAVISDGDAGIYGMAGLIYEVVQERGQAVSVEVTPGVSALNAAAALLGAPLMTDFCAISLSDHLTPREEILLRVDLAAQAGFILCLYNPKSRRRVEPFERSCEILLQRLPPETPAGIVRAAYRPEQSVEILPLSRLPDAEIDMTTIIIIGNSQTLLHDNKMITRRGYGSKYSLTAETPAPAVNTQSNEGVSPHATS